MILEDLSISNVQKLPSMCNIELKRVIKKQPKIIKKYRQLDTLIGIIDNDRFSTENIINKIIFF